MGVSIIINVHLLHYRFDDIYVSNWPDTYVDIRAAHGLVR